jgi:hypothetical protein
MGKFEALSPSKTFVRDMVVGGYTGLKILDLSRQQPHTTDLAPG